MKRLLNESDDREQSKPRKRACADFTDTSIKASANLKDDIEAEDSREEDDSTRKALAIAVKKQSIDSIPAAQGSTSSSSEGFVRVKTSYDYYEDLSFGPGEKFNEDSTLFDFVNSVPGHLKYDKNEYERVFMISWVGNILCFQVKDMKSTKIKTLFRRANFSSWEILQIDCVIVKLPRFRLIEYNDCQSHPFRISDDGESGYMTE